MPAPAAPAAPGRRGAVALRFTGWFLGFSGLYAMSAVCPFCGRPGCPTGAASAGIVGLAFASLAQWGRSLRRFALVFGHAGVKVRSGIRCIRSRISRVESRCWHFRGR